MCIRDSVFDDEQQDGLPVRTATQRRAKGLTNLVSRGANRTETSTEPLVHVVMSLKVLQHTIAEMAKPVEEQDFTTCLDANDVDGRCELIDGTRISLRSNQPFCPRGQKRSPTKPGALSLCRARAFS